MAFGAASLAPCDPPESKSNGLWELSLGSHPREGFSPHFSPTTRGQDDDGALLVATVVNSSEWIEEILRCHPKRFVVRKFR